jgi:hypothetical protein
LNTTRSELIFNKGVTQFVSLLATGFTGQQILDFVWFLQSLYNNTESLLADMNKYGSIKKTIEVLLSQKLGNLESQTKPTEVEGEGTNIPN